MNETHPSIEQLIDYHHGELPPAQDAAVHAHIASCADCAQAHAEEVSLTELLRAHARTEERELPESVVARIREAATQRTTAWERIRTAFRPIMLLPAAAAVAIALYLGVKAGHGTARATTIDAAYYVDTDAALTATAPFSDEAPMPALLTSEDPSFADEQPVNEAR